MTVYFFYADILRNLSLYWNRKNCKGLVLCILTVCLLIGAVREGLLRRVDQRIGELVLTNMENAKKIWKKEYRYAIILAIECV